jgi:hypothetical protein
MPMVDDARARYDEIAAALAELPDVQLTKMMGMPSIKRAGKLVAGFSNDEGAMVFKLTDPAQREAALGFEGAHLFEPMAGRQMKEWVVVPAASADRWSDLADQAVS